MAKDIICEVCGTVFQHEGRGRKKYCTVGCAQKKQQEQLQNYTVMRRERRGKIKSTCKVCGKEFSAKRWWIARYCSDECRAAGFLQSIEDQKKRRARRALEPE